MFRLFTPPVFQGPRSLHHRKGYFEGWYYKFVSKGNRAFAVIPGVSLKEDKSFAFIQTIDGDNGKTSFTEFPISDFKTTDNPFSVSIGDNTFSADFIKLGDRIPVSGKVKLINTREYKTTLSRPGIMGWYRYVPGMECYHGVVSTGHKLEGTLNTGSEILNFSDGSGYIEKDWGTSFPSSYIWMQSNSFREKNHSFMLSVARIPWFGSWFRGFLGFLDLGTKVITFSTYTGAKLHIESIDDKSVIMKITGRGFGWNHSLKNGSYILLTASRNAAGQLLAPQVGSMERRIGESIDAQIHIEYYKEGKICYKGSTGNSGLEIVGDLSELM